MRTAGGLKQGQAQKRLLTFTDICTFYTQSDANVVIDRVSLLRKQQEPIFLLQFQPSLQ